MQKLFTIDRIGIHGKLSVVRTDKGELLLEHAGTLFTEFGFAMETANWSEGEQNFIKGIIKFAKKYHESIPQKLKKCPFCGQTSTLDLNGDQFIVECDCGCVVGSFDSKWDAVRYTKDSASGIEETSKVVSDRGKFASSPYAVAGSFSESVCVI